MCKEEELISGPCVSVITIVKNARETVEAAILSVARQEYKNIEYIIIDGHSTDGTLNVIASLRKYVNVFVSEPDRNATEALNKGLRLAQGSIIFFLNADDEIPVDFLEKAMRSLLDPAIGFVFGDLLVVSSSAKDIRIVGDPSYNKTIEYTMPRINYPSLVFKKSCFEVGIFDENVVVAPDYDLMVRLHRHGVRGIYNPSLCTIFRAGGNAHQNQMKAYFEIWRSSKKYGGGFWMPTLYLIASVVKEGIRRSMNYFGLTCVHIWIKTRLGRIRSE